MREREREIGNAVRRGQRKRERERLSSWLPTEHRVGGRAASQDPEIMTWAKIKSQSLNWLSHPGIPIIFKERASNFHFAFAVTNYVAGTGQNKELLEFINTVWLFWLVTVLFYELPLLYNPGQVISLQLMKFMAAAVHIISLR